MAGERGRGREKCWDAGEMEELQERNSTVGRGCDRRNTYPVSFTLWLQLIQNRLSFERFSVDRLRRARRKEGCSHPPGTARALRPSRVWPIGGLTLSQRQLHPVFYARLFRHAFTVAQSYHPRFLRQPPFSRSSPRLHLNFFVVSHEFLSTTLRSSSTVPPLFFQFALLLPSCLLDAPRSQAIGRVLPARI